MQELLTAQNIYILAACLALLELALFGATGFIVLALGAAFAGTALCAQLEVMELTIANTLMTTSIIFALSFFITWPVLKKMQNKVDTKSGKSDLIGFRFKLKDDINQGHIHLGIEWRLNPAEPENIPVKGELVEVVDMSGYQWDIKKVS